MLRRLPISLLFFLAAFAVLGGCSAGSPTTSSADPTGAVSSAILGGTLDTTTSAVVTLIARSTAPDGNDSLCTGTVIAPHVVLTAAHCVDAVHLRTALAGDYTQYVLFGDYKYGATLPTADSIVVKEVHARPDYTFATIYSEGRDVGLIVTKDVLPRTPLKIVRGLDKSIVGTTVRMLGSGVTDPKNFDSLGKRHSVTAKVEGLDDAWFWTSSDKPTTCHGDSGGPTLRGEAGNEVVIGVHSYGEVDDCSGAAYEARIEGDVVTSFIASVVAASDPGFDCFERADAGVPVADDAAAAPATSEPPAAPPATTSTSGCSLQLSAGRGHSGWLVALVVGVLLYRRRREQRGRLA
jgi:Trypsin